MQGATPFAVFVLLSVATTVLCIEEGAFSQLTVVTQSPTNSNATELAACATAWLASPSSHVHVDLAFTTILYTITSDDSDTAVICTARMNESSANDFICSTSGVEVVTKFEGYRPAAVPLILLDATTSDWPRMLVFAVTGVGALLLLVQTALLCRFRCSHEYALSEQHKRERIFF